MNQHSEDSIEQLEMKISFQESIIEALNQEVIQLQTDMLKLKELLSLLSKKLGSVQTSNIASASEETPPPHY